MKVKNSFILFIFFISASLVSCEFGLHEFLYRPDSVSDRSTRIVDLPHQPVVPVDKKFRCVIFTDIHFGKNHKRYDEEFLKWLRDKPTSDKPLFVISLGDIADHGKENEYKEYAAFLDKIKSICTDSDFRIYTAVGNHDLLNSGWRHWKKYVYPHVPYYRFKTGKFSWYFIDTGNGVLGEPQLTNLVQEMRADPNPKFVFSHYAIYGGGIPYFVMLNQKERAIIIDTFARNNVKAFFAGHYHNSMIKYDYGYFFELVVKSILNAPAWIELSINENDSSFSVTEYQ